MDKELKEKATIARAASLYKRHASFKHFMHARIVFFCFNKKKILILFCRATRAVPWSLMENLSGSYHGRKVAPLLTIQLCTLAYHRISTGSRRMPYKFNWYSLFVNRRSPIRTSMPSILGYISNCFFSILFHCDERVANNSFFYLARIKRVTSPNNAISC